MLLRTLHTRNFLVIFFLLFYCYLAGQISRTDSLKGALNNHITDDTTRVNLLNKIAYEIHSSDAEQSHRYAIESHNLARKLGYTQGIAESLWLQGISFVKNDPEKALEYFKHAFQLVNNIGYKKGVAKYTNAIGTVYGATGCDSLAVNSYIEAIKTARQIHDFQELGKYLINLSSAYNRMGKIELAVEGYNDALVVLRGVNNKRSIAICYNSLGNIYTYQGNYPIALECFQNGLKIREEILDSNAISKSLVSIGSIYFAQKNYERALEYNQKAAEISENTNDKHALAGSLLNIGLVYLQTNDKQSLEYFRKALEISEELKIVSLQINILLNIGQFYFNEQELDKALGNFMNALDLSKTMGRKSSTSFAELQIAKVYYVRNEFSSALKHAQNSLEIAHELKFIETEKDLHKLLSDIYYATNNYRDAYFHSQLFKKLSDTIFNENNIRQITELEFTYKFEKEKQAIALEQLKKDAVIETRKKHQAAIIIVLAVCLFFASILALYINRLYRFKNRANQAISKLEQEKKRLLEQELERIHLELEQNQKALTVSSLKLIQNSERDAETVRRLESTLGSVTPEAKKTMLSIISDFKRISRSSNWNEFELLFQQVHKSFYNNLNSKFPDLTANERKLCAFLKLNMSSKDIANITFQSEEALKKARMRLRQKLSINRETNLVAFLQNI